MKRKFKQWRLIILIISSVAVNNSNNINKTNNHGVGNMRQVQNKWRGYMFCFDIEAITPSCIPFKGRVVHLIRPAQQALPLSNGL